MTGISNLTRRRTLACAALLILVSFHSAATASGDAMDFPRNALGWHLSGDAEQLWAHAGAVLRELAEDVEGLREAADDIREMMGPPTAMLDEQIFDHPGDDGWRLPCLIVAQSVARSGRGRM